MIFSRKKIAATDEPVSIAEPATIANTARDLAERVRRTAAHQLLEHRVRELRASAARLLQRAHEVRASAAVQTAKDAALKVIGQEQSDNDMALRACRVELAPYRERHALAVETALAPLRRDAATKVATAATTLKAALADLNGINAEARRLGVDAPTVHVRGLDDLGGQIRGI